MADEKPKHKPSPKRTLEEVLKSLQDLIRSDLVSRRAADKPPPVPSPPPAASIPDAFDQALDELDELITHELIEPAKHAREAPPGEPGEVLPGEAEWPLEEGTETGEEAHLTAPDSTSGADAEPDRPGEIDRGAGTGEHEGRFGVQDVLPFEEPTPSLASFLKDAAPPERLPDASAPEPAKPAPRPATPSDTAHSEPTQQAGAPDAPDESKAAEAPAPLPDDGIPVLHDVVAEIEATHELATPEQAREIAIRVVARLNIERRKAGEAPLDIRTIERLQKLLKDALAPKPPHGD